MVKVGPALTSRRLIAANTVWSLLGLGLPALLGLALTPAIVHGYGDERFGVLTLAWMVVGYFSLFDLGLGRAITREVAQLLGAGEHERLHDVVWTGWTLMLVLGLVGGAIAFAGTPWLVERGVRVSAGLEQETLASFRLLALSIPLVVFTTGPRGVLEAAQRFGLVNAVRIPTGALTFLVPLVSLQFTPELPPAIIGLIVVRAAGALIYMLMAVRVLRVASRAPTFHGDAARGMLRFGAWITVSNVISPLMVTFDRFVISGMISVAAVTYYAAPSEVATRLFLIPGAIAGVLFPAFSSAHAGSRDSLARLFQGATRSVLLLTFPIVFALICFAPEALRLWLGEPFTLRSTAVLRWLLFGMLINSVAQLAFGLVQSAGRSDLTAKVHVAELVPYLLLLVPMVRWQGITGAAFVWTLRIVADTGLLIWLGARESGLTVRSLLPPMGVPAVLFALCVLSAMPFALGIRAAIAALFAVVYAAAVWRWGGVREYLRRVRAVESAIPAEAGERAPSLEGGTPS